MKQILLEFKNMDDAIISLMKYGIKFSFGFTLFSSLVLLIYDFLFTYPIIYYIGFSLFKTSLFFIASFIAFSFAFNQIKKDVDF